MNRRRNRLRPLVVLHYSHPHFLCQAQNEFICSALSAFPIVLIAPLLAATGHQSSSPLQSPSAHAGEGSHTLIFLQCCQRRQTHTAPQTETTFRWPPSKL